MDPHDIEQKNFFQQYLEAFEAMFERKIEMIKFVRQVSNMGIVEAKNTVEWFVANCPNYSTPWTKIGILATISQNLNTGKMVLEDGVLFWIDEIPVNVFQELHNVQISGIGVKITSKKEYTFPTW